MFLGLTENDSAQGITRQQVLASQRGAVIARVLSKPFVQMVQKRN